jgi:parallel beta-helix repeat protein
LTNKDVVIEGNAIMNVGAANNLQGITIFDGKWEDVRILNNVVITNQWHGISISGVTNAQIINNTVISSDPRKYQTWISVGKAKDGTLPQNVVVRNNITTRLNYDADTTMADHNIVAKMINVIKSGKQNYITKPGSFGNNNFVRPDILDTFVNVDNVNGNYNLRLRKNSPAIGAGNALMSPNVDITGKQRGTSIDIGAYAN